MDLWAEAQKQYPGDSPTSSKGANTYRSRRSRSWTDSQSMCYRTRYGKGGCGRTTKESPETIKTLGNLFGGPHLISLFLPPK
jgi:hypothetical protein